MTAKPKAERPEPAKPAWTRTPREKSDRRTLTIPEAGEALGICRNAAYEAARRGEIPTIKIGRLLLVPKIAFERMFEQPVDKVS
jgi:excisionase family DNA binding protein